MPEPVYLSLDWNGPSEKVEAAKINTEEQLIRYITTGYANPQTHQQTTQKARSNGPFEEYL